MRMKQGILSLALLLIALPASAYMLGTGDFAGQSFLLVRPLWQTAMPDKESMCRYSSMEMREEGFGGSLQFALFGSKSTNPCAIAQYFSPNGTEELIFANNETDQNTPYTDIYNRDVQATHFNISLGNGEVPFTSRVTFNPSQTVFGFGVAWKQTLFRRRDDDTILFWGEIAMQFSRIKNSLGMEEEILQGGGTEPTPGLGLSSAPFVNSVTAAFQQNEMLFGKIDGTQVKDTVPFIEFKFGWNAIEREDYRLNSYVGAIASPVKNKPTGIFLFEPVMGPVGHTGLMYGSNLSINWWSCRQHAIRLEMDINTRYFLQAGEMRSFDVLGKPWSRYMAVYADRDEAAYADATDNLDGGTFGINVFTRCVAVEPRYSTDMNTAFIYTSCNWTIEGGWNFYAHQSEQVSIPGWDNLPAFKDASGLGNTSFVRTIDQDYSNVDGDDCTAPSINLVYPAYAAITADMLDVGSATSPAAMTHTPYLNVGYTWDEVCYPTSLSMGASYEFTAVNTALNRWEIWAKFVVSF